MNEIIIPEPVPSHEWTSTIKRPDGVIVSVTVTVPPGHPAIQPDPTAFTRKDWPLREMNEITYMCANSAHGIVENNWSRRGVNKREDRYWNLNLDVTPEAIEAAKPPVLSDSDGTFSECPRNTEQVTEVSW